MGVDGAAEKPGADADEPCHIVEEGGLSEPPGLLDDSIPRQLSCHPRWRRHRCRGGNKAAVGALLLLGVGFVALALGPRLSKMESQPRPPNPILMAGDIPLPVIQLEVVKGSDRECHTAEKGEECYKAVTWGRQEGWVKHPKWYPKLDTSSTFEEFQEHLHQIGNGNCPKPCSPALAAAAAALGTAEPDTATARAPTKPLVAASSLHSCLCLFDVDRTLTGKQGFAAGCPGNKVYAGIHDEAYGGGDLTLSALGQGIHTTFCGQCHVGIVSAGGASGFPMRDALMTSLNVDHLWSSPTSVMSPLVIGCRNSLKATCASNIVSWYGTEKGIVIPPHEVYFFDDTTGNTAGFAAYGFNARQVSCASRDAATPNVGLCGATPQEVVRVKGVFNCA
mmetsp:Transcript_80183/g.227012  ORF Transcript_80183/g.227012 Transcript_80183/m.227012 type:complete len:392 (-) Transcript_80183:167-1342(-)